MKFTADFATPSLFRFCVRWLNRIRLGTIVLALCVNFAYAESDVQIETVTTSPRGTFRIEHEAKRDAGKGEWATTFWISLTADPSQRVQLDEPVSDPNAWHFFISPDEHWICATVHEHSQLQSLMLYRCKSGLQFKLVATEDEETEGADWNFDKNDRFGPKDDLEADETGRVYNHFVAWSSDSARLLVEKRVQLRLEKDGEYVWRRHYFYFNLHRGKLEHTPYLLTLNRAVRANDAARKEYVVPSFAEPVDALPSEKELHERYEAAERRLTKTYPAFLERAEDENEKQDRRRYQQLWLKARESDAETFAGMGSESERPRRKLLYLADATENRADELKAYLAERARSDDTNKKQAAEADQAAKELAAADEKMRVAYETLQKALDPAGRDALEKEQDEWRKAAVKISDDSRRAELINTRALELKARAEAALKR